MPINEFEKIARQCKKYTDYIYLHVLGETLLYPYLEEALKIVNSLKMKATVVTNGFLIKEKEEILLKHQPYKIVFSLHSFFDNQSVMPEKEYFDGVLSFAKKSSSIISLRVLDEYKNHPVISFIKENLSKNLHLNFTPRFIWHTEEDEAVKKTGSCLGAIEQFAILSDGTVTPCCLDYDGVINLGSAFAAPLDSIIKSERAKRMKDGFLNRRITEEHCGKCKFDAKRRGSRVQN